MSVAAQKCGWHLNTIESTLRQLCSERSNKEKKMLGTILLVILILALIGAFPTWPHSRAWGYRPVGGVGVILVIVLIVLLLGGI